MSRQEKSYDRRPRYYQGRDWRKAREESRIPKRAFLLLLFPISLIITLICKQSSTIAEEVFSKRLYKWISVSYSWIISWIPFSVTEIIYIVCPIFILVVLIRFIVRMIRRRGERAQIAGRFLLNTGCVISVLLFLFTILSGVNYYRYSFTYYSGLTIEERSPEALYDLCVSLITDANEIREQVPKVNKDQVFELTTNGRDTGKRARDVMSKLGKEYPILDGWNAVAKSIFLSKYMSYTGTTGVCFPFTMESNVDTDIEAYWIPATMCHELSHLRGFMREDEANFIAYLACINSEDVEFEYSGIMLAIHHAMKALRAQDKEQYLQLVNTFNADVYRDLLADQEYWEKHDNKFINTLSDNINDTYLKANNQSDGIKSYNRMVDLLLAYYEKSK